MGKEIMTAETARYLALDALKTEIAEGIAKFVNKHESGVRFTFNIDDYRKSMLNEDVIPMLRQMGYKVSLKDTLDGHTMCLSISWGQ